MKNYKELEDLAKKNWDDHQLKLQKWEDLGNQILSPDGTPVIQIKHACWNTKTTENGVVEIPMVDSFKVYFCQDEFASANTYSELEQKLISMIIFS